MAIIRVKSIDDLELPNRPIHYGSNSYIYRFQEKYFKLFHPALMDLEAKNNKNRLMILKTLMDNKSFKYLILPEDIYVTDSSFLGYTMPICLGKPLDTFLDTMSYKMIIEALKDLLVEIEKLSNLGLFNPDIWSDNVLFDGKKFYLIDLDNSYFYDDKLIAYRSMGFTLFNLVLDKMVEIDNLNLWHDIDINYMRKEIESLNSDDYIDCLSLVIFKLERIYNRKIENIGDIRAALKLSLESSHRKG